MNNDLNVPLVSICIPTYNGATYLAEALDSALVQTYPNLEIIISDDASKDQTLSIIEAYKGKTSIPITVHHHEPKGIGANWNHCVAQAKGDYIKFLFQDDVLLPDCISKMMAMMLSDCNVGLVYCKRTFLYDTPAPKLEAFIAYYGSLHTYWGDFTVTEQVISGQTYLRDRQLLDSPKNKIGEPTAVLLKKACFERSGYFNAQLQQTLDCECWYRILRDYHVGFVNDALVQFRLHDEQASVLNKQRAIPDGTLLYRCYYKHLYKYLHPKNQWKLLTLYHPLFKLLTTLKRKLYA